MVGYASCRGLGYRIMVANVWIAPLRNCHSSKLGIRPCCLIVPEPELGDTLKPDISDRRWHLTSHGIAVQKALPFLSWGLNIDRHPTSKAGL
ncbi:hypothetical protein VNO77_43880 [Canavalia gladiata]|uniref:Uncharacterized protein n=1 Tax=Canavalia gladiata TaxID=3824 RepID=A0AAN9JVM4_CANGL